MKSHRQLVSGVHNLPKHRMVFILMNKPTLKLTPPNIFILHCNFELQSFTITLWYCIHVLVYYVATFSLSFTLRELLLGGLIGSEFDQRD